MKSAALMSAKWEWWSMTREVCAFPARPFFRGGSGGIRRGLPGIRRVFKGSSEGVSRGSGFGGYSEGVSRGSESIWRGFPGGFQGFGVRKGLPEFGVRRVFGGYLERVFRGSKGIRRVFGGGLRGLGGYSEGVSGGWEDIRRIFGGSSEGIRRVIGGYSEGNRRGFPGVWDSEGIRREFPGVRRVFGGGFQGISGYLEGGFGGSEGSGVWCAGEQVWVVETVLQQGLSAEEKDRHRPVGARLQPQLRQQPPFVGVCRACGREPDGAWKGVGRGYGSLWKGSG
eukprot:727102-Prorocentrum_minimum.AAC.1